MTALTHTTRFIPRPEGLGAFAAFVRLEVRRALRNRRYLMFAVAFPVVFYVLYTGVLSGTSADATTLVGGIQWRTYFMVSMATYGAIGAALGGAIVIAQERDGGWARQLRVTPLPSTAYVAGKLVVAYLVTVPAITAVLLAGLVVDHVELGPTTWLAVLVVLALGSLPFAALGLLIGYLFDANSAQGAMMISFFSLAILGGLWAPLSSFPDTLATIGGMLPSSRLADLGRDAAAGVAPDPVAVALLAAYAIVIGGLAAWRYRSAEPVHA
jgi:ABC-2 type transport system permease protein